MKSPARVALGLALLGVTLFVSRPTGAADPADGETPAPQDDEHGCLRCHEDLREQIGLPVEHMPAAEGMCASCHSPHAARFPHLLNRRERALCYVCHAESIDAFQTGSVHTPVKQGECGVCHQVHGSENEHLLARVGNELCLNCHVEHAAKQQMATTHEPFIEGECTDCHSAHNSPYPDQLVAPSEALCRLCHEPDSTALVEVHNGIPVDGTRCNSCHDAHAAAGNELLLPVAHEPFDDGECDMCHLVESETPVMLRATGARLCGACHQDVPREQDTSVHAPVANGECAACHVPHASRSAGLLVSDARTTCTSCHAEIEERAAQSRSVHPFSFEGELDRSCLACHDPHSAGAPGLLAGGAVRTCFGCHENMRHGHPMGEDRIDPRTGEGITCVTCHDPHGTDFAMLLRGSQTRGLCLECHTLDGSGHSR